MKTLCSALFAVFVLAPLAASADRTSALRHLAYDVSVGVTTNQDLTNYYGHMTSGKGSASARGTITADVTALGEEKALYIRVAENSDARKAPPVNVEVLADGRVAFNPKDAENLNPEEQALLSLLGRAVVADHELSVGSAWKVAVGSGGEDVTTYHVLELSDPTATLSVERDARIGGAQPMQVTITGKVVYDYKRSAPVSASLNEHVVTTSVEAQNTSDLSFQYRLTEDSLAGVAGEGAAASTP